MEKKEVKTDMTELRGFAKRLDIAIKGLDQDSLTNKILDEIEARYEMEDAEWKKENSDLLVFFNKFAVDPEKDPVKEEVKSAKEKKAKEKKEKKEKVKKAADPDKATPLGSRKGSMSGVIDDFLIKGAKKETIVKALMKDFNREENKATSKVDSHIKSKKAKGFTIEESDGVFKAILKEG
jgi:hypothetical protein